MGRDQVRTRLIQLPDNITRSEAGSINENFSNSDAVLSFNITENILNVLYSFPNTTTADIWILLNEIIPKNRFSKMTRWKDKLDSFIEINEQNHLQKQYGWDRYITNIYVTRHQISIHDSNMHKLWKNYKQDEKKKFQTIVPGRKDE